MLTIGRLGQAAGVKVPTMRYYEQIGPLPLVCCRAMVAGGRAGLVPVRRFCGPSCPGSHPWPGDAPDLPLDSEWIGSEALK